MNTQPAGGGPIVIPQAVLDAMPEPLRDAALVLLSRAGVPGLPMPDTTGVAHTLLQAATLATYLQTVAAEARDRAASERMDSQLATAILTVAGDQRDSTAAWRSLAAVVAPALAPKR